MSRALFDEDHEMLRDTVRKFVEREMLPHVAEWEEEGCVSKDLFLKAGEAGLLCPQVPEEYGGMGLDDFRFNVVINEELVRAGSSAAAITLHNDIVSDYILLYGTEEQKKKYLPKMVTGEIITAIAMTEPGTGSDLQAVQTFAEPRGDEYVINGQKTFITNGILADLVIIVAKTSKEKGHRSISLICLERPTDGFEHGRNLDKIGLKAQDTAELFLTDVHVPRSNLLGEKEGQGFIQLMEQLPRERLSVAVGAAAICEHALETTVAYCHERKAFGQEIGKFQNSRFMLAEMKTEITIARIFIDECIQLFVRGELTVERAAMAKWWTTELLKRVTDQCLQLHGGYGYMMEYPIARMYLDARAQTIYAGTTEIMKEIIGRSMGF